MPQGMAEGSKATQFKPLSEPLDVRFHKSYILEPNSGCWLWLFDCDNKGYARIRYNGKSVLAHRISYFLHKGPTDLFVCHICDVPCCVNPYHLYAGTQKDNMRDRSARGRMRDQRGEASVSPLSNEQVLAIRADNRVQHVIAKQYGVCQAAISNIKLRKTWKHI